MSAQFTTVWQALSDKVESGWAPGMVAGIRHGGTTEFFATGVRTLGRPEPMRTDSPFRIASLGKPVAGALAASMIADGSLAPDDPADVWLPELAYPRVLTSPDAPLDSTVPADRDITVRHLLTLTHGMGAVFGNTPLGRALVDAGIEPGPLPPSMTHEEFMHRVAKLPLEHQPGACWKYHTGSDLLSVLLARAGQAPLGQILAERITDPLGMAGTGFFGDPAELPTAYRPGPGGLEVLDPPDGLFSRQPAFESLGSGLVSTVPDYLAFLTALAGDTLVPAEQRRHMTSDQLNDTQRQGLAELMGPGISWGWQIAVDTARRGSWTAPGGYGWTGGTGTTAYVNPDADFIGVLFTQRAMAGPGEDFSYFWEPLAAAL
ncbi:serine hydrolase [Arthrobacter sp. SDTb3-6]|uniref:serine hydrolase domain-containing protein n=1 Tax=Arthrobacter sp. SDTb3-6 TaxID=2713571 RepID=UPI00159D1FB2|nr:serine hydrolase domain-containing protein [Arthrobacter sp. SDTb3-6]NVN00348.1 beta-lactamase family protein [Arthrobacter sp. SDTb3-6]